MYKIAIFYFVCMFLIISSNGERTKDKMYEYITGASACFRRLNGTHQTGCTSKRPGSTGVIHVFNNDSDLQFILETGPAAPYVVVLPVNSLDYHLKKFIEHKDRIAGVVIHLNITRPSKLSFELPCPNEQSNLPGTCSSDPKWNTFGTSVMHENIPFPIFLVEDDENLTKIVNCFEKFNNYDRSQQTMRALCALELAAFMFATNNSKTCISRSSSIKNFTPTRFCDPLGSRNVWSTLQPRLNKSEVILVVAQLDSTSMFYDVTPGAVAPLSGLVTLITTAYLLKQKIKENKEVYNKTIMYALFNGESYDYIGSQRFVYDIVNDNFPMKKNDEIKNPVPLLSLSDIKLIVEIGQINMKPSKDLFMHHIEYSKKDQIEKFKSSFTKYAKNYQINLKQSSNTILPPSSLQSFLREEKTIEGIVLANYDQTYSNNFYHSIYDDEDNLGYTYQNGSVIDTDSIQSYIGKVSTILAQTLFEEISGKVDNSVSFVEESNDGLDAARVADEMFHCYLDTSNCNIYQALTIKEHIDEHPFGLYVSVDPHGNKMTTLTAYTLAWLTGDVMSNVSQDDCRTEFDNPVYQFVWMSKNLTNINDTACFRTTMNFSLAVSPAFIIDEYNWKSNRYSTWTESVWNDMYMRMFLVPSHRHEIMTISVGTVTFVLSLALVYFVHTRADILFAKPDAVTPGTSC